MTTSTSTARSQRTRPNRRSAATVPIQPGDSDDTVGVAVAIRSDSRPPRAADGLR